jgi:hypothetical protein
MNADKLVKERESLLNTFFKECGKYDYIVSSAEFEVFSRGSGEIDKVLSKIPDQRPSEILKKYRDKFEVDEGRSTDDIADLNKNSM